MLKQIRVGLLEQRLVKQSNQVTNEAKNKMRVTNEQQKKTCH